MPARSGFAGCPICKGSSGCPKVGRRCSAGKCKKEYARRRAQASGDDADETPQAPATDSDNMPSNKYVVELLAILGERCCLPHRMRPHQRRGGPGNAYSQQFLVRGYYMETDAEDEEEGVEEMHEANTYWVDQEVLLDSIDADDVKKALKERFKRVLADIY